MGDVVLTGICHFYSSVHCICTVKNFRKKTETVIWFHRKKLLEYKITVIKPKNIVFKHAIRKITEKM